MIAWRDLLLGQLVAGSSGFLPGGSRPSLWAHWHWSRFDRQSDVDASRVAETLSLRRTAVITDVGLRRFQGAWFLEQGDWCYARNILEGSWADLDVILIEFHFTQNGLGRVMESRVGLWDHYVQQVTILPRAAVGIPDFRIGPRTFSDRLGDRVMGRADIGLNGSPGRESFSKQFWLWGHDRAAVDRLFRDPVAGVFAADPARQVEVIDEGLFLWRTWTTTAEPHPVKDYLALLEDARRVLGVLRSG